MQGLSFRFGFRWVWGSLGGGLHKSNGFPFSMKASTIGAVYIWGVQGRSTRA